MAVLGGLLFDEIIGAQFSVLQNFAKQSNSNGFSAMNGDHGCSTVDVGKEMVAATYAA